LCAGIYTCTVVDANACAASINAIIAESIPITVSTTTTPTSCGQCTGGASATFTGGTPPYQYIWNPGGNSIPLTNVCAGTYSLTVSDANGCITSGSATVHNGLSYQVILDTIINANCANGQLGSITVHATGANGPFTYTWSIAGETTPSISNLEVGTYYLGISDNSGCQDYYSYHVGSDYNLYAAVSSTNANCTNNGSVIVTNVTGVNPPFTFLWNDPLNQTDSTASNLSAGFYTVTITDHIGCTISATTLIYSNGYDVIKGRIYLDENQNCMQDNGELGLSNIAVYTNTGDYGYTNPFGDYIIYTYQNASSVSAYANQIIGYTPTCPVSGTLNVNFSSTCDTSYDNNFGFYSDPNYFDLSVFYSWTGANPGFNKTYRLFGYNYGPTAQNATLRLTYDPALQYSSSDMGGINNPTLHIVEWTAYLQPYSYFNTVVQAEFYVPTSVSITDTLCALFEILPITGDANPLNNTRYFCQPVTGSWDPNSKDVFPRGQGPQGYILQTDSVLYYTIHFQNTGNDTAFTVEIKDTLSQYLNPATIVPGASSHPYTFDLTGHGILTFRFDNILLPDSNVSEPKSNGYLNYTVNMKHNLPIGTVIENKASIFFDFNEPIVTNTTVNTIASPLKIKEIENNVSVTVYPNPFNDYTMFEIHNGKTNAEYSIDIYDMLGKCVRSMQNITENYIKVSAKGLESGIYSYKVLQNKEVAGIGKIIIE